jgi:hypothetical protein
VLFMQTRGLAKRHGRWLAVLVSLGLSAGMLYAQNSHHPAVVEAPLATPPAAGTGPTSAGPTSPGPANAAPPAALLAAAAPVEAQKFQFALAPGIAPESGLQIHTIWVARAISIMFPEITTIGGYRQDPLKWHPNGLAIDVMIPNHNTDEGKALGDQIAGLALAMAQKWGVIHVIWRQGFYPGIGAPSWTADYGNETANHFDHVHIATDGGGYPTGRETYYLDTMTNG